MAKNRKNKSKNRADTRGKKKNQGNDGKDMPDGTYDVINRGSK